MQYGILLILQGEKMFDKIKKAILGDPKSVAKKTQQSKNQKKKTQKEIATEKNEPWVGVLGMEVDIETLEQGAFELDWNDQFVAKLIRAGYQGKTDADIVDRWFQSVCRNVVLESYEKEQALQRSERIDENRTIYK